MIIYWAVIKKRKQKVCFDSKGNAHRFSVASSSHCGGQFSLEALPGVRGASPADNFEQ